MKTITLPGLMDTTSGEKEISRATYLGNALVQFVFRRGVPLTAPMPACAVKVLVGPRLRLAYDDPKGMTVYRIPDSTPSTYAMAVRLDLEDIGLGKNDYTVWVVVGRVTHSFNFTVVSGESSFSPGAEL